MRENGTVDEYDRVLGCEVGVGAYDEIARMVGSSKDQLALRPACLRPWTVRPENAPRVIVAC